MAIAKFCLFKYYNIFIILFYLYFKKCAFEFNYRSINLYFLLLELVCNNKLPFP